ncbi:hypothetical protein KIPB_002796 [Kipferlia bialata]|uniref:Translation initiation factor IF2/IF5 domain-containing protein n=1 Tax=Kipferlia bialata TaxID=797122 RepID=A0A9K3CRF7_9EUKA|nr:hypothetical protein KIPB_002796 [Kipferlia bialata]|eukprot:g2796.t1
MSNPRAATQQLTRERDREREREAKLERERERGVERASRQSKRDRERMERMERERERERDSLDPNLSPPGHGLHSISPQNSMGRDREREKHKRERERESRSRDGRDDKPKRYTLPGLGLYGQGQMGGVGSIDRGGSRHGQHVSVAKHGASTKYASSNALHTSRDHVHESQRERHRGSIKSRGSLRGERDRAERERERESQIKSRGSLRDRDRESQIKSRGSMRERDRESQIKSRSSVRDRDRERERDRERRDPSKGKPVPPIPFGARSGSNNHVHRGFPRRQTRTQAGSRLPYGSRDTRDSQGNQEMVKEININFSDDAAYRYKMPEIEVRSVGRGNGIKAVIDNMRALAAALGRDPHVLTKYFGKSLGARSVYEESSGFATFNGSPTFLDLNTHLKQYILTFVLCHKCNNPETHFRGQPEEKPRALIMDCASCGHSEDVTGIAIYALVIADIRAAIEAELDAKHAGEMRAAEQRIRTEERRMCDVRLAEVERECRALIAKNDAYVAEVAAERQAQGRRRDREEYDTRQVWLTKIQDLDRREDALSKETQRQKEEREREDTRLRETLKRDREELEAERQDVIAARRLLEEQTRERERELRDREEAVAKQEGALTAREAVLQQREVILVQCEQEQQAQGQQLEQRETSLAGQKHTLARLTALPRRSTRDRARERERDSLSSPLVSAHDIHAGPRHTPPSVSRSRSVQSMQSGFNVSPSTPSSSSSATPPYHNDLRTMQSMVNRLADTLAITDAQKGLPLPAPGQHHAHTMGAPTHHHHMGTAHPTYDTGPTRPSHTVAERTADRERDRVSTHPRPVTATSTPSPATARGMTMADIDTRDAMLPHVHEEPVAVSSPVRPFVSRAASAGRKRPSDIVSIEQTVFNRDKDSPPTVSRNSSSLSRSRGETQTFVGVGQPEREKSERQDDDDGLGSILSVASLSNFNESEVGDVIGAAVERGSRSREDTMSVELTMLSEVEHDTVVNESFSFVDGQSEYQDDFD